MSRPVITFGEARGPEYPRELLEHPHWYALRTRARAEKKTDELLRGAGVESYAAIAQVDRAWADRTRTVGMPLFSGYIFVRLPLVNAVEALKWPGAVELVKQHGVPVPLRDEEVAAVRRLAEGVSESRTLPTPVDFLEEGDRVRVKEGAFRGMEGTLVELRNGTYVSVRIEAIRQAKAVQVERSMLERLRVKAA